MMLSSVLQFIRRFPVFLVMGSTALGLLIAGASFDTIDLLSSESQHAHLRPIVLSGANAFYNHPDYLEETQRDLASPRPLPPSQVYDFQSRGVRIACQMLVSTVYPWKVYQYLHSAYGNFFLKPSPTIAYAEKARQRIELSSEWKYFRFSLLVDGKLVDAMVVGRPSTFENGRWMLMSLGITRIYECLLIDHPEQVCPKHPPGLASLQKLLTQTNCNAVLYNYPGMGASSGALSTRMIEKAHEAFLRFLEDEVQASVIVDKGHSFGGGVQAAAWSSHQPKKNVSYVLVKDRTFIDSSDAVSNISGPAFGLAGTILGWNIHTSDCSDNLPFPEIHVMSVRNIDHPRRFNALSEIAMASDDPSMPTYNDMVIPASTSSALHYLHSQPTICAKTVIGVPDAHGASIEDPSTLADAINEAIETSVVSRGK